MATEIAAGTADRLTSLATTARDAQETYRAHRDKLHEAIVEAIDGHGMRPSAVAKIIGVSTPRVYAIIERVYRQ